MLGPCREHDGGRRRESTRAGKRHAHHLAPTSTPTVCTGSAGEGWRRDPGRARSDRCRGRRSADMAAGSRESAVQRRQPCPVVDPRPGPVRPCLPSRSGRCCAWCGRLTKLGALTRWSCPLRHRASRPSDGRELSGVRGRSVLQAAGRQATERPEAVRAPHAAAGRVRWQTPAGSGAPVRGPPPGWQGAVPAARPRPVPGRSPLPPRGTRHDDRDRTRRPGAYRIRALSTPVRAMPGSMLRRTGAGLGLGALRRLVPASLSRPARIAARNRPAADRLGLRSGAISPGYGRARPVIHAGREAIGPAGVMPPVPVKRRRPPTGSAAPRRRPRCGCSGRPCGSCPIGPGA